METHWDVCFFWLLVGSLADFTFFYYFFVEEKVYEMHSIGYKKRKEMEEWQRGWRMEAKKKKSGTTR